MTRRRSDRHAWAVCLAIALGMLIPSAADAQIRAFGDVGGTAFAARQSFAAILGSNAGLAFGVGAEAQLPHRLFASVRVSQFRKSGHRVFIFEGERYDLDVDTTVTVTPLEFSGGYRYKPVSGLIPYGGGGIGWHRYRETSKAASDSENVDERFLGFQAFAGVEYRVMRLAAAALEGEWARVPNALGADPNGVAAAFDEHDLGGFSVRVKVVIGR
jgi:opacity protein-like surface antigen